MQFYFHFNEHCWCLCPMCVKCRRWSAPGCYRSLQYSWNKSRNTDKFGWTGYFIEMVIAITSKKDKQSYAREMWIFSDSFLHFLRAGTIWLSYAVRYWWSLLWKAEIRVIRFTSIHIFNGLSKSSEPDWIILMYVKIVTKVIYIFLQWMLC